MRQESFPINSQNVVISQPNKSPYQASRLPCTLLMYARETCPLRVNDTNRLERLDHCNLHHVAKIKWHDCIPNAAVHQHCINVERISSFLQKFRLPPFGNVLRQSQTQLTKTSLLPLPSSHWICRLGGQMKTWVSTINTDLDRLGF